MDDLHAQLLAHRAWLHRLAADLVRPEAADDVAQETLRIALERPPAFAGTLRTWLARVAQRVALRLQRSEARRSRRERERATGDATHEATTPAQIAARQQWIVAVAEAVRDLDEPLRATVYLRYYEDLAPTAIAERTAVPVATVKTRLQRAKELLRRRLDQRAPGADWRAVFWAMLPVERRAGAVAGFSAGKLAFAGIVGLFALFLVSFACVFDGAGPVPTPAVGGSVRDAVPGAAVDRGAPPEPVRQEPARQEPKGIRARCVRGDGSPIAGARLVACLGPALDAKKEQWPRAEPRKSGDDGFVVVAVPDGVEVMFLVTDPRWRLRGDRHELLTIVTAPATPTFEMEENPTARLRIRAHDLGTGEALRSFQCRVHGLGPDSDWPGSGGAFHGSYQCEETTSGEIECHVAIAGDGPMRVQVDLAKPRGSRERLTVRAGVTHDVSLTVADGDRIAGVVVDPTGQPVVGALVFAGTQLRARGDEPGRPFQAERIRDGVTTDAAGAFALAARTHVTAWHPEFGARTVRTAAAQRIVLEPLVALVGTLVDVACVPRQDVELRLDRHRVARTDAAGAFRFERVEPGRRLVVGDCGPWLVSAGGADTVTLAPGLPEVRLACSGHGEARTAALVGLGPVATFATAPIEQGIARLCCVLPGDYLFVTERGACRRVVVAGPELVVDLGSGDANGTLVVAAGEATTVHVVPAYADELTRVFVARLVRVRIDADREVRLGPLPPGDYEVCRGDEPHGTPVVVHGLETKVRLE